MHKYKTLCTIVRTIRNDNIKKMNNIYEVVGTKFDFTIKPTKEAKKNCDLWFINDFSITAINGKIYLQTEKLKHKGEGYPIKKAHFLQRALNLYDEPDSNYKYTLSDIKNGVNFNPESIRQIYLDIVWFKR